MGGNGRETLSYVGPGQHRKQLGLGALGKALFVERSVKLPGLILS